jgi:hypothetical protein
MIQAGETPFLVRAARGRASVFLLACLELADVHEPVDRTDRLMSWFSRFVPLAMFLRGTIGPRGWHSDRSRACFIIDDPPLTRRYGFLDHARLAASMRRRRFSASIAFIPWNYRRTPHAAALFTAAGAHVPGLCVHGCDHTRGEFDTDDAVSLRHKARVALERMRDLHRRSGISFDDVMVFPQGLFSNAAQRALAAEGYQAAVNTDVLPSSGGRPAVLRDLLAVAVGYGEDVPVFGRRYPRDIGEFAFDLFVGKPAIGVEHHGYFRHGCGELEAFVERLNALDERIEWTDLGTLCARASMTRETPGETHVRFFTNRFSLCNSGGEVRTYVLHPRHRSDRPPPVVTVGGRPWPSVRRASGWELRLSLDPGATADVVIAPEAPACDVRSRGRSRVREAAVRARRYLSEFRDNHIETNVVLRSARAAVGQFRRATPQQS